MRGLRPPCDDGCTAHARADDAGEDTPRADETVDEDDDDEADDEEWRDAGLRCVWEADKARRGVLRMLGGDASAMCRGEE